MIDFTYDGHIHTPFCPHGTTDSLEQYVEQALLMGLKIITFTEHAPTPGRFVDPTPEKNSAMSIEELELYLKTIHQLKASYHKRLDIKVGLEIDYLAGYESETIDLLEPFAHLLDETILSQHFLQVGGKLLPVDFSPETFDELVQHLGSFEAVVRFYYEEFATGLHYPWERLKVKRIGHLDLPIKYQLNYAWKRNHVIDSERQLLHAIASRGFGLDLNTAGLRKPACQQVYAEAVIIEATQLGIPFVLGSDAHLASDVGFNFKEMKQKKATFL